MEYFRLKNKVELGTLPLAEFCEYDTDVEVHGIGQLGIPNEGCLTFCDRPVSSSSCYSDCISMILTSTEYFQSVLASFPNANVIIVDDPRARFIDTVQFLIQEKKIGFSSSLPNGLSLSNDATISEHSIIEPGVQIDEGVVVSDGAVIRRGTWLQANSIIGENCVIGIQGIYVYIGCDGHRRAFPHLGSVIIEQESSLGAGCIVPRGMLNSTRIGTGSVIGNLCNIGHGTIIESNVWISSGSVIGGQTKIGRETTIGLGCVIRDNISIGNYANIGMGSVVTKNVPQDRSVFGNPARKFPTINAGPKR